jgi:PAS domain S-box-containing protein
MSKSQHSIKAPWFPLVAFACFAAFIFAAGFAYYYSQVHDIRSENCDILSAIAELKIMQIVQWRQGQIRDALLLANDPHLVENVREALFNSTSVDSSADIMFLLRMARKIHNCRNIIISEPKGSRQFSALAGSWPKPDAALAQQALHKKQPVWGDLVRDAASGEIYLDIVTPIPGLPGGPAGFSALLTMRIDPLDSLFPLIQDWPTKSASAETLLARREGDEVVYLNELRHRKDTALQFRVSVYEETMPAARAARGELDFHSGIDYRGKLVIYAAKQVPDSSWLMIAKIDDSEILAKLRLLALVTGLVFVLSMAVIGVFIYNHLNLRRNLELQRETELDRATRYLNLRVRELSCLYGISSVVEKYGTSMHDILSNIVDLLPDAWEYPEITCARIIVDDRHYPSKTCFQTEWEQSANIAVQGEIRGRVEVFYLENRASAEQESSTEHPPHFITEVAERIALTVEWFQAQDALQESVIHIKQLNAGLEEKVAARTAQLQLALDTLKKSEERYRIVADFTCDWEFWMSPEKKYLFISPSFESMTGYPVQALYDDYKFLETIIHPDDRSLIVPHIEANEQTHKAPIDFRIRTREGQERWISHMCQQVFADDGRFLGMRGSNRDITEMNKLRDEAIRDAHLASIGRLAAGVAHEINNPISGVINYAQIIKTKCSLEGKYAQFLDELIAEAERVATIVKDMLMFARPHSGVPVPADLHDVYDQTFSLVAKQLDRSFVTVKSSFSENLPPVLVKPQQIKQVILNFFSNAVYALNKKFPKADPGKVIEVEAGREGPLVRLTFHDHGIGIPADLTARVCDHFFSTKPPGEGTGLGLSISHTIIKDHGGRLHIESIDGEYTKVTMELPAMEDGQ